MRVSGGRSSWEVPRARLSVLYLKDDTAVVGHYKQSQGGEL